ncbi:MAG: MlaD family protein [Pseudomonadota bacterium]
MTDDNNTEPDIEAIPQRKFSRVWIVPVLALVIGGYVIVQSIWEQGPLVEIRFDKGHGFTAGKTQVKHNDVVVGVVEEVRLSDDLDTVVVNARMERFMGPYLGDTTSFWVVKADISGTSFTGLNTLLSGAYIEVDWDERPDRRSRRFIGLDEQPMTPPGVAGGHFQLRADTAGSVGVGSPVFYRRIRVGQIESQRLSEDFSYIEYDAFIEAPYDSLINQATHFWNVSGINVEAGTDGLVISFDSLQSLLAGGVAFGDIGRTIGTAGLNADAEFIIYRNREAAVESQYFAPEGSGFYFMALFDDSIRGLTIGAPIEWQGIRIGNVRDIVLDLGDVTKDERLIYAVLELQPSRIGLEDVSEDDLRVSMTRWVQSGMRVQLASGNILTGRKLIRFIDDAAPVDDTFVVDFDAQPFPALPTIGSELGAMTQNVEQVIANVAELPLDQLIGAMIRLLNNADALVGDPAAQGLPKALNDALAAVGSVAGNVDAASSSLPELIVSLNEIAQAGEATLAGLSPDSALYIDLSTAVRELRDATRSLSALAARLEEKPNAILMGR